MLTAGAIASINCGLYEHIVLITDEGTVIHNSKDNGEVTEEFSWQVPGMSRARVLRRLDWQTTQSLKVRARAQRGRKWALFDNCEHFISEIVTGEKVSPQLQFYCAVTVIAALAALLTSKG